MKQALTIYRELNDRPGEALASRYLGMNLLHLADYEASRQALDRAIELYRELNDAQGLATAYNNLVYLADRGPEKDTIREHALRYAREANDKPAECSVTHEWGDELFQYGDFIQAKEKLTTRARLLRIARRAVGRGPRAHQPRPPAARARPAARRRWSTISGRSICSFAIRPPGISAPAAPIPSASSRATTRSR